MIFVRCIRNEMRGHVWAHQSCINCSRDIEIAIVEGDQEKSVAAGLKVRLGSGLGRKLEEINDSAGKIFHSGAGWNTRKIVCRRGQQGDGSAIFGAKRISLALTTGTITMHRGMSEPSTARAATPTATPIASLSTTPTWTALSRLAIRLRLCRLSKRC